MDATNDRLFATYEVGFDLDEVRVVLGIGGRNS
jgi:hypothetical protein